MANLIGILQSDFFIWGVVLGVAAGLMVAVFARRSGDAAPLPIGGVLITITTLIAVTLADEALPRSAVVGLALIAALTAAAGRLGNVWVMALASVPGAVVLGLAARSESGWVMAVTVLVIPLAGALVADFDTRYGHLGLGMIFYGLAATGTFLAVPDTELVRTLFAVCLPLSFLAWPRVLVSLGRTGSFLAIGVFAYFTALGGIDRPASVIGAIACLGFLVLEPAVALLRPRLERLVDLINPTAEAAIWASIPQLIVVYLTSRVAAHFTSLANAILVAGVALAAATLLLIWLDVTRVARSLPGPHDV